MRISATVSNEGSRHEVALETAGARRPFAVGARASGQGSGVNGGEFLMLALATCYCNDLYREAARLGLRLRGVDVEASADFEGVGLAAANVRYSARVYSDEPEDSIARLLRETDAVAEVHNTLRSGVPVSLVPWQR